MSLVGVRPDHDTSRPAGAAAALRTTTAVRERCAAAAEPRARRRLALVHACDDDALPAAAAEVADVTRARYPDLRIPYHSRWRHFEAGGVDRKAELDARLARATRRRVPARMIDLTVVSVLLDAGAGAGLALPRGRHRPALQPLRGPGGGELARLRRRRCSPATRHIRCRSTPRPARPDARTGWPRRSRCAPTTRWSAWKAACCCCAGWAMRWRRSPRCSATTAGPAACSTLVAGRRPTAESPRTTSCRRCWRRCRASGRRPTAIGARCRSATAGATTRCRGHGLTAGWVPFHKLSQWLTYSLLEPFEWAGVHGARPRRADRPARIPQRRPAARHRRAASARTGLGRAHLGSRATSWSSSGAR